MWESECDFCSYVSYIHTQFSYMIYFIYSNSSQNVALCSLKGTILFCS